MQQTCQNKCFLVFISECIEVLIVYTFLQHCKRMNINRVIMRFMLNFSYNGIQLGQSF